jgi:hypothetical protein
MLTKEEFDCVWTGDWLDRQLACMLASAFDEEVTRRSFWIYANPLVVFIPTIWLLRAGWRLRKRERVNE